MARHFNQPKQDLTSPCIGAQAILGQAYNACESFHVTFREFRTGVGRGTTSDAHQDILRAMLIFAWAGLDSAIKRLVRDALQSVIDQDAGAQTNFTETIRRRLPDID